MVPIICSNSFFVLGLAGAVFGLSFALRVLFFRFRILALFYLLLNRGKSPDCGMVDKVARFNTVANKSPPLCLLTGYLANSGKTPPAIALVHAIAPTCWDRFFVIFRKLRRNCPLNITRTHFVKLNKFHNFTQ